MNGKAIIKFLVVIAAIIGLFAYFIQPLAGSLKQGLDLQGGTHIVLEAEDSATGTADNDEGAKKFADLTSKNIGRRIAITLDGKELTNPVVQQAITGGKATISGSQSLEEAKDLAILLRSGALPVKINVLEVRTVGPSLGQDSKDKSVVAFSAGIAMIMIFLVILYRFSGIVANIALLVYVMLLLLVLGKGFNATMTLPGIAGIILSMGVAVDANILIFERFKEEVFSGKSMRVAMEAGFSRALATITDANVSVIITAGILTILGSGPVKGFAISLGVGVVVSMFTAITVSHFLLRLLIDCNFTNHPFWFGANISPSTCLLYTSPSPRDTR